MARKSSKKTSGRRKRPAVGAVERDRTRQIKPMQNLSDLVRSDVRTAYGKAHDQVLATLQLPHIEEALKRTRKIAAIGDGQSAGLKSAQELAREAAAALLPSLLPQKIERIAEAEFPNTVTSARDLGRIIRTERENRRLSQQAFADLVGVGRRFISELENGKATLEFDKVLQVTSATGIYLSARRR